MKILMSVLEQLEQKLSELLNVVNIKQKISVLNRDFLFCMYFYYSNKPATSCQVSARSKPSVFTLCGDVN